MSNDPFEPPISGTPQSTRESALARVKMPARLLFITGILSLVGAFASTALINRAPVFLGMLVQQMQQAPNGADAQAIEDVEKAAEQLESMAILYYAQSLIGMIGAIVMLIGAGKMKNLEGYGLSMTACILAIVPFTSSCCSCVFPLAVGVWGVIVLANQDVKSHFS